MKRLFFDIETSPNVVYSWRAGYKIDISHDSIISERKIITVAWKWQGENKVHATTWDKKQDDKALLERFIPEAEKANEVIAHYGDGFDIPWVRGRALYHGLQMPILQSVDTKAWASRYFYLNSNKLDYLARYLGFGKKIKTDYQLWLDVIRGDSKSLAKMVAYNKHDVELLEKVWGKLALLSPVRTHAGVVAGNGKWSCPRCASEKVCKWQRIILATGTVKHKMKCNSCGGTYRISDSTFKEYQEAA